MNRSVYPRFANVLKLLLFMILTLMALGAGVRTMRAGLACPDWPLCFGKVIPDFHPGVYFEFVHRAYAGLVALVFAGCLIYAFSSRGVPKAVRRFAVAGLFFLVLQILMGALTVLKSIGAHYVTSHLMLATLFFCSVLAMLFSLQPRIEAARGRAPALLKLALAFLALAVFFQVYLGGYVASTYAGSVCVDWPLCNGQWVPTWQGAIGLQIMHRFFAYFLAVAIPVFAWILHSKRSQPWMTRQLLVISRWNAGLVLLQVAVGVANLLMFIPPSVTVLHQSIAITLLAVNIRAFAVARSLAKAPEVSRPIPRAQRAQAVGVSG